MFLARDQRWCLYVHQQQIQEMYGDGDAPATCSHSFILRLEQEDKNAGAPTADARVTLSKGQRVNQGYPISNGMLRALRPPIGPRLLSRDPLTLSSCVRGGVTSARLSEGGAEEDVSLTDRPDMTHFFIFF